MSKRLYTVLKDVVLLQRMFEKRKKRREKKALHDSVHVKQLTFSWTRTTKS